MAHTNRYEMKYVMDESRAAAVRRFVAGYLRPSAFNNTGPFPGHPVISLYLDSPDLVFFRQAFTGHRNRAKLRIRFYDSDWNRPAFLEVKRRVNDVICKGRAKIPREVVRQMLCGIADKTYQPHYGSFIRGRKEGDVFAMFWGLCRRARARGVIYVSYVREIWEAPDDEEFRITFDRQITATPYDGNPCLAVPSVGLRPSPYYILPDGVVMELKFEDRPRTWMLDLVRRFDLRRIPMCKYSMCVDTMRLQWGYPLPGPCRQEPLLLTQWADCRPNAEGHARRS
jgi:hypothetical protein